MNHNELFVYPCPIICILINNLLIVKLDNYVLIISLSHFKYVKV